MQRYVGAIDQGTTGTRFMIFDHAGRAIARHEVEHAQLYPRAGWVEHDPLEIWEHTRLAIRSAMDHARIGASDLAAIGVANQRETTVVWNPRTGRPYGNAIAWQDLRAGPIVARLAREGADEAIREKTGLPVAPYFSGPKVAWVLSNVDGVRAAAERGEALFGTIDSWLIWNLTGGPGGGAHVTDPTNASRTMLMNLRTLDWDGDLLGCFDIPRQMLPEIRPSSDPSVYGTTDPKGPAAGAVPVCGDLGDQQAALVGQGCFERGESEAAYGTGTFLLLNTGTEIVASRQGLVTTVAYRLHDEPARYALEGPVGTTGAALRWLHERLGVGHSLDEVEALANSVKDSGGVTFVPALAGLLAPYWRSDVRAVIAGLTGHAHRGHVARAALEAIGYRTREVVDAMVRDSSVPLDLLRVGGPGATNDTLMQLQADILGRPLVRPAVVEVTGLGAAYAAGLATGFWQSPDETARHSRPGRRWEPRWSAGQRERGYAEWKKAVQRASHWSQVPS